MVRQPDELPDAIAGARREARGSFGDDTLLVERYVGNSRHIEVQVLGDAHGNVDPPRRARVQPAAPAPEGDRGGARRRCSTPPARAVDGPRRRSRRPRRSATPAPGTVEFIVDGRPAPTTFFFLEMNTRLQVEHPVTELVTGLDLVEQQIRVAAGERLPLDQSDVSPRRARHRGPALRRGPGPRLPARRPARCSGCVEPSGPGIRVDSSLAVGTRRRHRLRPDAGQGHRLGARPARPRAPGWSARSGTPPSSG